MIDDPSRQRQVLTFSVEGFAAREELLFKGYVRLLDHLTEHRWQYHEPSTLFRVDLLVSNEHVQPTKFGLAQDQDQATLQLGTNNLSRSPFFLTWPLKPNELEHQLNGIGRLICKPVTTPQSAAEFDVVANATDAQATVPAALNVQPELAPLTEQPLRLQQWPKPMLLMGPGRMRLATLLTSKAMTLEELLYRSALPRSVCESFLADMRTAGLVADADADVYVDTYVGANAVPEVSRAAARPAPAAVKPWLPAILERQADVPLAKPVVQLGLLTRIRMRFGIKTPHAH